MFAAGQPDGEPSVKKRISTSPVRRQEVIAVCRPACRHHLIGHTDLLKDADGLVIDMGGARKRIDLGRFVGNQDPDAGPSEQQSQRIPGRPGADDDDVAIARRAHAAPSARQTASMAPNPSISQRTVSPGLRNCRGSIAAPTPPGVPVKMMSPGSSVIACDNCAI